MQNPRHTDIRLLIVGLGNMGSRYASTRHNAGFMVLDALAACHNLSFVDAPRFHALLARERVVGRGFVNEVFYAKPTTMMNASGLCVSSIMGFYKIEHLLVVHDELDLPLGSLRFKKGGSDGGHNGLRSITELTRGLVEEGGYDRARLGITHPRGLYPMMDKEAGVVHHVLSDFRDDELAKIEEAIKRAIKAIEAYTRGMDIKDLQARYSINVQKKEGKGRQASLAKPSDLGGAQPKTHSTKGVESKTDSTKPGIERETHSTKSSNEIESRMDSTKGVESRMDLAATNLNSIESKIDSTKSVESRMDLASPSNLSSAKADTSKIEGQTP